MNMRDMAYCGLFGALALALPTLFHAFGLAGPMFLPMYWPLVTLAFLVSPGRAALVAMLVPWASSVLTGMPLLWPPMVVVMSVELALQVLVIGIVRRWQGHRMPLGMGAVFLLLAVVLTAGRFLHAGLVWLLAREFPNLPAGILAGASFLAGWPGVVAMLVFVPVFVGATTRRDGVCEVRFLKALRRLHLPEGVVLVCAQTLRWFEALSHDAEMLSRALELRRGQKKLLQDATRAPLTAATVEIRNLLVRYAGASEAALTVDDLSFTMGEKVALLGPNGGGKTTLLSVLAGFTPYAGEVRVFGQEPRGRALRWIRGRLGVLFENPDDQFLFPTVREDVGDVLMRHGVPSGEIPARVDELLSSLGLPTGNRPVAALSRGQRQRVALAALLAAKPDLLLLDEPTSALDETEKVRLADVLAALPGTVLVATHDRSFAERLCSRCLLVNRTVDVV